ncbi:DUF2339 domain-containing protein [Anoxybacteroides rupiense]|uniref:DUF2339 domain-containing protein n=1 Tax=Anoxybacteroides rupiense TaxID=311460 RepID=UPI001F091F04|nr:DUF2339 domain-containing protein [Anoxybacillus rupiensis]
MSSSRLYELEEKMERLETEIASLKAEHQAIMQELTAIRKHTGETKPPPLSKNKQPSVIPVKEASETKKKTIDWEVWIGQVWLPRIFVFVLLLGILWAFKVASNAGLFSPSVKSLLGFAAGGALLIIGQKQIKQNRRALGLVLHGGAISLWMITTFAIHVLYHFISAPIAFVLNVIWIVFGIFLSNQHLSQILAIFVGIGGYLIPFLLEKQGHHLSLFTSYEVLLYFSLLIFALKKRFTWLYIAAFALLHAAFFLYIVLNAFLFVPNTWTFKVLASAVFLQHLLLLAIFLQKTMAIREQMATMFASFVLSIIWLFAAFAHDQWVIRFTLAVMFFIYASLAFFFHKKDGNRQSLSLSIATFALMILFMHLWHADSAVSFLLLEGSIALFLGGKLASKLQQISGGIVYAFGSLLVLVNQIHHFLSLETLCWSIWLATLYVLIRLFKRLSLDPAWAKVASVSFIAALFLFISQMSVVLTEPFSPYVQQMSLSFSWAAFAAGSVVFGTIRDKKAMRLLGIGLIFLTLLKLVFIDLPIVSLLMRSILFIGLGSIGIIISRLFYRQQKR